MNRKFLSSCAQPIAFAVAVLPEWLWCDTTMAAELAQGLDLLELGCRGNVELVTRDEPFFSFLPLKTVSFFSPIIIMIMCSYHALIKALIARIMHICLNTIFYTHLEHSPTKTIYVRYYLETYMHACTHAHPHTPTHTHLSLIHI